MSKLSVLLLCLLIPSLCDIVSMYHTSKQIQDLATLTDLEGSGSDDEDEGFYSGSGGSGYFQHLQHFALGMETMGSVCLKLCAEFGPVDFQLNDILPIAGRPELRTILQVRSHQRLVQLERDIPTAVLRVQTDEDFEFDTKLRFTTGVTRAVTSTPSTSAFGSIQPFAFTFRSTTLTSGSSARVLDPTSAALTTQQAVTAAPAPATVPAAAATTTLRVTTASTGAATTSTVKTPATHSSTIAVVPLATTGVTATTKQSMTSPGAVARPVSTPDPQTNRATLESFTMDTSKTLLSIPYITEKPSSSEQVEETTINNEVEAPAAGSPSGDFELTEEGEVVNPEGNNEVFAAITQPTVRGTGKIGLPDIIDNAIDSGSSSSAAQLPQKNILERKEVLVAVVVGGVVGALFAAFLVMLLIYRMKKKDEGSYTLEEPKQASIAYQKPDKQEEFYA